MEPLQADTCFRCGVMGHRAAQSAAPSTVISPVYIGDEDDKNESWTGPSWGESWGDSSMPWQGDDCWSSAGEWTHFRLGRVFVEL